MQALKRVRHIQKDTLYYSTYPRCPGNNKHFDLFSRERLMRLIERREAYRCTNELLSMSTSMQSWMKHLWVFNTQEDNVSAFLHEDMLHAYLRATGYTVEQHHLEVEEVDMRECWPTTPPAYGDIETVDDCAYDRLRDLLRDGRASTRDKLTWAKAHFQRRILRDWTAVDPKTCAGMFSVWIRDQSGIADRLDNIRMEKSNGSHQRYQAHVFQNNQEQKLAFVREIMKVLDLSGSYAVGETVIKPCWEHQLEKYWPCAMICKKHFGSDFKRRTVRKAAPRRGSCLKQMTQTTWRARLRTGRQKGLQNG